MARVRPRSAVAVVASAFVLAIAVLPSNGSAASRTVLRNSASPIARSSDLVRRAAASETVEFELYLGLGDLKGAESALARVSDPTSPDYTNYLSPDAFRARFARPQTDVEVATTWLVSQGFRVGAVSPSRTRVAASGTAAQVERAFQTSLNYYRANGHALRAPATAPSIPSSLDGVVRGVLDLAQEPLEAGGTPPPPDAFRVGKPCSAFWGQLIARQFPSAYHNVRPFTVCGYSPQQIRGAYGVDRAVRAGTDGAGVRVAVVDAYASPTIQHDINRYSKRHDLPPIFIDQITRPSEHGVICDETGWWGEETLDIDAVHGVAPGADILYWGAASCFGGALLKAVSDIVDHNRAQIITNSYGSRSEQASASSVQAWHDVFVQAGAQGIGVYFSSGDSGDNIDAIGYRSVTLSASDPAVTAVGGTSLGVDALDGYSFETGWGTGYAGLSKNGLRWSPKPPGIFFYGSGGGTSRIFAEPDYQEGVVNDRLSGYWGGANRVVPDIAMNGDPNTGYLVGQTQTFPDGDVRYSEYRLGGTSLSSPLFAGIMAIADQAAGYSHGFANPVLYSLDGTDAVRDIVNPSKPIAVVRTDYVNSVNKDDGLAYSLRTMNFTGTLHTRQGYDDVTGVGSPNGRKFLNALSP